MHLFARCTGWLTTPKEWNVFRQYLVFTCCWGFRSDDCGSSSTVQPLVTLLDLCNSTGYIFPCPLRHAGNSSRQFGGPPLRIRSFSDLRVTIRRCQISLQKSFTDFEKSYRHFWTCLRLHQPLRNVSGQSYTAICILQVRNAVSRGKQINHQIFTVLKEN